MKSVAVLGGGPAGSIAAERLASAGLATRIFDEKLAWEKPCGGGLTYKAYKEFPFLIHNDTPKKLIHTTSLSAPNAGEAKLQLTNPLVIYSRFDLNHMLLKRAEKAGASIEQTRVMGLERSGRGWKIKTRNGTAEADFCVIATGARNPFREVGTEYSGPDTMSALGYYVPGSRDHVDIQFLKDLEGYIWVFPRSGHLSVGICGKGHPAQVLRVMLERYMDERGLSRKDATFYSHMLPSLESPGWKKNRVAGDGWMAVGDAGGLVDPITGEGLYYAMKSGDMASEIVLNDHHDLAAKTTVYRAAISREFALDLEFAATLAKRVFLGSFMFSSVPARMVQFIRRSPRFCELMQDLFSGTQPYLELRARLLKNLNGTLQEVMMNFFLNRVIPESSRPGMKTSKSAQLFLRAQMRIPGGVNSPVRAFKGVGGVPRFIARSGGSRVIDVDGNSYIDYVGSWGPMLLGHRFEPVLQAVREALEGGTSFGAPTEREVELAELLCDLVPSMEMVRLVNSGTEATMSALRLARGFTGRDLSIKFEGCYHGHVDSLLVKAGSGLATLGIADCAGVPKAFAETTMALPFNSIDAVERAFKERGNEIAAVIVEPVVGNMGCVPPAPGFLEALRSLTAKHGALLIFDEVMTGFRVALGGAQQRYGIKPDLSTFGKIAGGGLPLAVYGGRKDIMQRVAPLGPVYQAGTLSGNPLAVAAGLAMLRQLATHPEVYDQLEKRAALLTEWTPPGVIINRVGAMFTFFFTTDPVTDWESAKKSNTARYAEFFHFMLERGVYLAPSQFEAAFLSAAHSEEDIRQTVEAARAFFTA